MANVVEFLSSGGTSPSSQAGRNEAAQAIQIAIQALPPDYRDVIRLRHLEGKSIQEISALMQRSPGAIRGLLDRAKQELRTVIGPSTDASD